jgi:hypothetical protein
MGTGQPMRTVRLAGKTPRVQLAALRRNVGRPSTSLFTS